MLFQSNRWIVGHGSRRRDKNQSSLEARFLMGPEKKFAANSLTLVFAGNREVGKVRTVGKISNGSRDTDKLSMVPGRHDHVGLIEHHLHSFAVLHRATLTQSGTDKHVNKLVHIQVRLDSEFDFSEDSHLV